jgi:hypothetical protein
VTVTDDQRRAFRVHAMTSRPMLTDMQRTYRDGYHGYLHRLLDDLFIEVMATITRILMIQLARAGKVSQTARGNE